jgi:hypothetical protein
MQTEMETAVRIFRYLDMASSIFTSLPLSDDAKKMWLAVLSRFDLEQIDSAFKKYMDTGERMVRPADIVKIIEGSAPDRSLAAWNKVTSAMREVGDHRSICFDDPLIHAVVVDMGGWTMLCRTPDEKLHFVGTDFQKRYQQRFIDTGPTMVAAPRCLTGYIASVNRSQGYEVPEDVVLYGDEEMAEMVFRAGKGAGQVVLSYRRPVTAPALAAPR